MPNLTLLKLLRISPFHFLKKLLRNGNLTAFHKLICLFEGFNMKVKRKHKNMEICNVMKQLNAIFKPYYYPCTISRDRR